MKKISFCEKLDFGIFFGQFFGWGGLGTRRPKTSWPSGWLAGCWLVEGGGWLLEGVFKRPGRDMCHGPPPPRDVTPRGFLKKLAYRGSPIAYRGFPIAYWGFSIAIGRFRLRIGRSRLLLGVLGYGLGVLDA